jgi:hypothetical protein
MALQLTENIREAGITVPICLYGLYAHVASLSPAAACISRFISGEYEPSLVEWVDEVVRAHGGYGGYGRYGAHGGYGAYKEASEVNKAAAGLHNAGAYGACNNVAGLRNGGTYGGRNVTVLDRYTPVLPCRDTLPPLARYARLSYGGREYLTGYLEVTRGCAHKCLHCPVPSVYNGRIRKNHLDVLLQDVDNLVSAGAEHITFGDPDFLNAPSYALSVLSAVHDSFPRLTFDLTIKVSHIVKYADLFPEIARNGCVFVVSAFESASDRILELLDKGHTLQDMEDAVRILRTNGIEPRVSLMPFTPWTTRHDIAALIDMAVAFDLIPNIDPVQWSIRLLVPPGSLLLQDAHTAGYFGQFDPGRLSYDWISPDSELDVLQRDLEAIATLISEESMDHMEAFDLIRSRIGRIFDSPENASFDYGYTGYPENASRGSRDGNGTGDGRGSVSGHGSGNSSGSGSMDGTGNGYGRVIRGLQSSIPANDRPRLTESWFCCAEPMQNQLDALDLNRAPCAISGFSHKQTVDWV